MIETRNSKIAGISVCVPKNVINNKNRLKIKDKDQFINLTGVKKHYLDEKKKFNTQTYVYVLQRKLLRD